MVLLRLMIGGFPLRADMLSALLLLLAGLLFAGPSQAQSAQGELLKDGGFENIGGATDWQKFGSGFEVDRRTHRHGELSVRCDSLNSKTALGARAAIELNQKR